MLNDIKTEWEKNKENESKIAEEAAIQTNTLELLEKQSAVLIEDNTSKKKQLEEVEARIKNCKAEIQNILGCNTSTKALQEHYNKEVTNANKAVADAMERKIFIAEHCNKLNGQLAEKSKLLDDTKKRSALLLHEIESYIAKRSDKLSFLQLKEILSMNQADILALRNEIEKLNNAVATAIATKAERERNINEHKKADVKPNDNEDIASLQTAIDNIAEQNKEIIEQLATISATLIKHEENSLKFAQYKEELKEKQTFAQHIGSLNTLFGSASGDKLMKLAQGYTLEILLDVANIHLKEITGRYELARISEKSLGIKIVDLDMLSETRSVHSLSGGETFLVSLALSLALSSISSNRMSIESLFIDEGFGALDSDTLKTVMSALERLQSQGRTIGVISHYGEMLEQIPVKVAVIKQNSGRSKIEIKEG